MAANPGFASLLRTKAGACSSTRSLPGSLFPAFRSRVGPASIISGITPQPSALAVEEPAAQIETRQFSPRANFVSAPAPARVDSIPTARSWMRTVRAFWHESTCETRAPTALQTALQTRQYSGPSLPSQTTPYSGILTEPCYWTGLQPTRGGLGPPPPPKLLASRVACMRGGEVIFREMNLSVHEGSGVLLSGPNGSGKSSMLRMLAGFIKPSAGWLMWEGHNLADSDIYQLYKVNVHLMGAKDAIKVSLSVDDNVRLWAELEGSPERVEGAIARVGLTAFAKEPAAVLSLGQRRRVQLARLLAVPRPVWLLDEPSVGLDAQGVRLLEEMIGEHRRQGGMALVATHTPIHIENATHLRFPNRVHQRRHGKGHIVLKL